MAIVIAVEQYFFCVCLSVSIGGIDILVLLFGYLNNLTIDNVGTANNTQDDKNGDENAPCPQPFVYI